MIAILVMVTVFSRITIISSKPCGDNLKNNLCTLHSAFHEDEIFPDISEQVSIDVHEHDFKKKREYKLPSQTNETKHVAEEASNTTTVREEFDDEVLREDHFTQHLSDVMVNTDSEITGLQASEMEDDSEFDRNKYDGSITKLTEHEEALLEENYPIQSNILDSHDTLV